MRSLATLTLLVALLAVSACSSTGSSSEPSGGGDPASLDSTSWTLTMIGETVTEGANAPTLVFGEGGAVSGNGGCNTFSGTATIGDGTIDFGALASTRMACADEAATQLETEYLAALDAATTWTMDGEELVLGGTTELRYAAG
jgi:heat shock protein HslJ